MAKINVLLAEDHVLVRQAIKSLLAIENDYQLCGETGNGYEVVELVLKLNPDIVIMDINLEGINGIDATEQIARLSPGTKVLIISMHNQLPYSLAAIRKGAMGYVTKNSPVEEVFSALKTIHRGRKYICEEMKSLFVDKIINNDEDFTGLEVLTKQEKKIIFFLEKGESSQDIANSLNISRRTVEVHRYHILKKLNLKNTAALVNFVNKNHINFSIQ